MTGDTDPVTPTRESVRRRLQKIDPDDFEQFVADVWEHLGWRTTVVGEPGDRGIDVIATRGEQKQLIQAKRYGPTTTVGSPEVQQYASLRLQEDGVDGVTIVTTGTFSDQAEEMAPDLDVLLVDGEELLGMIDEIDAWEVVAHHFDGIALATETDDHPSRESDRDGRTGITGRLRSWFG